MQLLINKFESKQATIAIIGLGYVGLPLMLRYSSLGYKVIGKRMTQSLVDSALIKAVNLRQPPKGLVFHSDRGSQYTSKRFRLYIEKLWPKIFYG